MVQVEGYCDARFERVREAFIENFKSREEVGAAVAVYKDGEKVVDLWGGVADVETGKPWEEDTIVCMMSVGKALPAIALLMLHDRGLLDLEAPVARYWPAFAGGGKGDITVRQMVGGMAALLYADAAPAGSAFDTPVMVRALEQQEPAWAPGTMGAYHSMTAGILDGELLRRIDGRPVDQFIDEEILRPLGIDFQYGVAAADRHRRAPVISNPAAHVVVDMKDPTTPMGRAWRVLPVRENFHNSEPFLNAMFPSANGHGNARAMARLYAALGAGGTLDGVRLMSPKAVEALCTEQWNNPDGMTQRPMRYALGVFLCLYPFLPFGPNPRTFGHPGAGGAVGIADPDKGLAFSYSPNFMCAGGALGERCPALIDALYAC